MKTLSISLMMCAVVLLWSGCGQDDDDPKSSGPSPENCLEVTLQNQFTELPAKVSVFFKVDNACEGTPVARLDTSNFVIYEKGRNDDVRQEISRFEAERKISDVGRVFAYNTVLLLDLSGSVSANSLTELKEATKKFIDNALPEDNKGAYRMGIWWFDGEDKLNPLVAPTANKLTLKSAVDGINASLSQDNSTDLYGAIQKGVDTTLALFETFRQKGIISAASMVVFTDGTDQAARYLRDSAYAAVDLLEENSTVFTIGLGGEIDENVLQRLGKTGFAYAEDVTRLEETFVEVGELIWAEANSYYLFEYCSPKRDGRGVSELTIGVLEGSNRGETTTTFDATGFTSGCNL